MNTNELFKQEVKKIPPEVKKQLDLSFAISAMLAEAIKEKGMTQKEFAKFIGCTEPEVCKWLGGTHNFTLKTIARISVAINKDLISL